MNKNLNIEVGNGVLTLNIEQITDGLFEDLEELKSYGDKLNLKPKVNYEGKVRSVDNFVKWYNETQLSPQDRAINELRELNRSFDARLAKIEEFINRKISKKSTRPYSQPTVAWHKRFKAGDSKVHKIAGIFELNNVKVRRLTSGGNREFGPIRPGEVSAIQTAEDFYDDLGEDKFRKLVMAIGNAWAEKYPLRKELWTAANYALFQSPKKLTVEAFHAPAKALMEEYSIEDLYTGMEILASDNNIDKGTALGKLITGELSL